LTHIRPIPESVPEKLLVEQFAFLVHHGSDCEEECAECRRLGRVMDILLERFQ